MPDQSEKDGFLKELPGLFWLGLTNLGFRTALSLKETRLLGNQSWYWRLRLALWRSSLGSVSPRRATPFFTPAPLKGPTSDDLIYGETPILTAWQLGLRLGLGPTDQVIDLGSGIGLPLLVANLAFGAAGEGCEIVPHRLKQAQRTARILRLTHLRFSNLDFLKDPLPEGNVYWLSPTTLEAESWKTLQLKMAALPPQTRCLSLTVGLPQNHWETLEVDTYPFSWGTTQVHLQIRK